MSNHLPEPPASSAAVPALQASPLLQAKLRALRRRHLGVAVGTGLAKMIGAAVPLLGLEMALDFGFDLPWAARAGLLLALSAALSILACVRILLPFLHPPDDDTLALMVEKRLAQFHSRLIAAIQLSRPGAVPAGAAPSLVQALVNETEDLARAMDFKSIVPSRQLKKFGAWAMAALLAALIGLSGGGQNARDLLKRAFLSHTPVPRKTRVLVADGDKKIGCGDSVVIEATAQGLIPAQGTLVIKSFVRRGQEFIMERATNAPNRFLRSIENVQQSFNYVVKLGDGSSQTHRVEVLPRPTILSMQCEQVYPAYTALARTKHPPGDLALLAGSTLHFTAIASKSLRQARARLEGLEQTIPLALNPKNPKQVSGEITIPARNLTGFSLEMVDADGMDSRDPAVYHIEILPDKAPTVRLLAPERKEELVTPVATLFVEFVAQDDFKVAKASLRYKVGEVENAPTNSVELDMAGAAAQQVRRIFPWKIANISPPATLGTRLEFWIEVADNNDVTGPGLGASDHQLARIVTMDEKRADLLTRAGDYLGTIGDVTGDQERLNQNLSVIILEKKK